MRYSPWTANWHYSKTEKLKNYNTWNSGGITDNSYYVILPFPVTYMYKAASEWWQEQALHVEVDGMLMFLKTESTDTMKHKCDPILVIPLMQFFAYFPYFEKMKVGLCNHHAVCVSVYPPPSL
jgi:hypothetical protein